MDKIIHLHQNFYTELKNNLELNDILKKKKITVLDGFNKNIKLVHRYYQKVYSTEAKRIVLCGINPGRKGAGKTGIPFLDFSAVSHLLSDIGEYDREQSAQFMLSIINEIGSESFYRNVYLTNIAWFGFTKEGSNLNYYDLPSPLPTIFTDSFIEEMNIVQPKVIVPLSKEVNQTLLKMVNEGRLRYPLSRTFTTSILLFYGKKSK
ncbi:DUF4918 family protein [Alkalihalophilus pseudofirmus]|uniref:DUF4918 family protein n=1 Tax=Alkalihalophilus pseudofirmus TaxID=79885 RepID=A0AAJ2NNB4_ALKPS|nr:uracil-DNA glycosylase family protein [Alkalihalophilus pseudofirmus]MDV2885513.1 DUF4918 family protein [Alkalihalophilus pseudofirmus]